MKLALSNNIKSRVNADWTPEKLSSLLHWYKCDTGISTYAHSTSGNRIVTEWQDQKGTNHLIDTATPADTAGYNTAHPRYDTSTKEVVFDHGGDQLDLTEHLSLGTFAIFVRIEFDDTTFGDFLFEDEAGNNFLKVQTATELRVKISGNRHDFAIDGELEQDTRYVIGYQREDTALTADDIISCYVNNTAVTQSGSGDGTQAITDTLDLEKVGDPSNQTRIKEIVICNNALSGADRTSLFNYLYNL